MSSKIKEEKKENRNKNKNKRKRKGIEKPRRFALKPEHGSRGIWRKPLKPGALRQLVGSHRFSARYRVDGWSLASCRCWSFEIIRSSG